MGKQCTHNCEHIQKLTCVICSKCREVLYYGMQTEFSRAKWLRSIGVDDPIQDNCKYGYILPDRCRYNSLTGCDCGAYPPLTKKEKFDKLDNETKK